MRRAAPDWLLLPPSSLVPLTNSARFLPLTAAQGPVREVRISRLALGLASSDGGGCGAWTLQALLGGQLLLPVSLRGVSLRLAPPPPKPAPDAALARAPAAAADAVPAGGAGGASSANARFHSGSGGARKAWTLRGPLALLAHVPLRLEGLTVLDEVGVAALICLLKEQQHKLCNVDGGA